MGNGRVDSPRGLGSEHTGIGGSIELFVLFLLYLLVIGLRASKTHIAFIDAVFTEILLT
jgi:hypothetical protein